jgi:hypothetical protein
MQAGKRLLASRDVFVFRTLVRYGRYVDPIPTADLCANLAASSFSVVGLRQFASARSSREKRW